MSGLTIPMTERIVRYGELRPCRAAFIDAYTPGSDSKENFSIIGAGVSESPHQHVHIRAAPGFNIGAAGQPPGCRNSLHSHHTAEVFVILKGRWRFFWGRWGTAGEVVLNAGDIINIPTGMFRGFDNVGADYGMMMSILGGDDAGGGVVWAPQVLEEAREHGLVLGEDGVVYDTRAGESLPEGVGAMEALEEAALEAFAEPPVSEVVRDYVARYWDLMALARDEPARVIGEKGLLFDKPGFEVDFLTGGSGAEGVQEKAAALLPIAGHWRLQWEDGEAILNPGDTALLLPGEKVELSAATSETAALYRVTATDDAAGSTTKRNGKRSQK